MIKKLSIIPAFALLVLTQACYTQLAWLHQPEPEERSSFSEYDPYGLEEVERSSDFVPYSQNPYGAGGIYGHDQAFWSYYGNYGSPFGLYSPYSSYYSRNNLFSPYGYGYNRYGYYPYSTGYGVSTPVIVNEGNIQSPRNWDRRGMKSSSGSNLIIRRELPLMIVTAQPIKKQSLGPMLNPRYTTPRSLLMGNSNTSSFRSSYNSTSGSRQSGSFSGSTSSGKASSSSRSSSSGRVTRRR